MDNETRRTRFETRIMLEREFLGKVNAVFGYLYPLSGMTLDAINQWQRGLLAVASNGRVDSISRLLLEASARAELMADDSKDVFEPDRRELDSLSEVRTLLHQELSDFARG
ncbi:hypothetical protein [Rhizobium leguminosarum]|uniref:hypothetical protein n=1 Tax=Rhizobium leguminosarum TaxID=384 RepID=UPI001C9201A6|nr:hypothetical protein [Rhizobium leguminosarum]MBY2905732.1 hypothetical protein [Rhizobium leguminosarum]